MEKPNVPPHLYTRKREGKYFSERETGETKFKSKSNPGQRRSEKTIKRIGLRKKVEVLYLFLRQRYRWCAYASIALSCDSFGLIEFSACLAMVVLEDFCLLERRSTVAVPDVYREVP